MVLAEDLDRPDLARHGYAHGVPMGGDLSLPADGKSPGFPVHAMRDTGGANLDRIQMIKGRIDTEGEMQERGCDLTVSDGRIIGSDGRSRSPVGNTVNVKEANYTVAIGAAQLEAFWRVPDFEPRQRAFCYVRAIEIPTPRWTTYDAKTFGVDIPEGAPTSIQKRACTSPIWYSPEE